jgi:hypothetical protein
MDDSSKHNPPIASPRILSPAAQRALAEAEQRRLLRSTQASQDFVPKEHGGREGLEPTRYGDWEVKGILSDF